MKRKSELSANDRIIHEASKLEDEGKISEAIKLYKIAADRGDSIAQSNLATLLDDKIRPSRPREAVYWYKRALRLRQASAAWNLAMHYKNLGQARWHWHWLQVAATMGDKDARKELQQLK
jgi:TPR repeat protein